MTLRQRTSLILTGVLFVFALSGGVMAAHATVGALRSFQRQRTLTKEGDVQTIQQWMTVPYISRAYHIPELYLYQSLQVPTTHPLPHVTLHALAARRKVPVNMLIHIVQRTIIIYRKAHTGTTFLTGKEKCPTPGRITS
ncbi:MAG TPA: hypothetical protein VL485_33225 [Ktedonobacteraceae bacterium]|nr:hypothetical protein [Ktedonobacteraceae bacterium]